MASDMVCTNYFFDFRHDLIFIIISSIFIQNIKKVV